MDRLDYVAFVIGALGIAAFALLTPTAIDVAIFVVGDLAAVAAFIGVNHTIPRHSKLVVSYRNPLADDRPVLFPPYPGHPSSHVQVFVRNDGRGPARSIEVRFGRMGADIYNESGNFPGPDVDVNLHPPLYRPPPDYVLAAGRERCIAKLVWHDHAVNRDGTVSWSASAADSQNEGVVRIRLIDPPVPP